MPLTLAALLALAQTCAPGVAPETLLSVAHAESAFDSLTIGVNGKPHRSLHPATAAEAARVAQGLMAQGRNLDLGLAQINARNLPRLGMSVADAFDPCRSLAAGARILAEGYARGQRQSAEPQAALQAALSVYNTGDTARGLRNGYVGRVYKAAAQVVPAIQLGAVRPVASPAPSGEPVRLRAEPVAPKSAPPPASLDVFACDDLKGVVWSGAPRPSVNPQDPTPQSSTGAGS